jgi:Protein of unknown function (DUF4236)
MGIRFRKSIKVGPMRFTLSKSGIGCSVGIPGYRKTLLASGRVQTTASIPGTGISQVTTESLEPSRRHRAERILPPHGRDPALGEPAVFAPTGPPPAKPAHSKPVRLLALAVAWAATGGLRFVAGGDANWLRTDDWFLWACVVYLISLVWAALKEG